MFNSQFEDNLIDLLNDATLGNRFGREVQFKNVQLDMLDTARFDNPMFDVSFE